MSSCYAVRRTPGIGRYFPARTSSIALLNAGNGCAPWTVLITLNFSEPDGVRPMKNIGVPPFAVIVCENASSTLPETLDALVIVGGAIGHWPPRTP